jgi:hypothetical protein
MVDEKFFEKIVGTCNIFYAALDPDHISFVLAID